MAPTSSELALYRARLRQLLAPLPRELPEPIPPPLPPGRAVTLPGRGEVFIREQPGPSQRAPLLLLHGWIASSDLNWHGAFEPFEGERRVVALDHRGHGRGMRSPAPFRFTDCADDAAALVGLLDLEGAIVAGYSMGGPIAMLLARAHRSTLGGMVLAASALTFSETRAERLRWRWIGLLELGARLGAGDRLALRWAYDAGRRDAAIAPHAAWLAAELTRTHPRTLRQAGAELGRFDARPWAGSLDLAAAVLVTEADSLVPLPRQRSLAAALSAHVEVLPGLDHDAPVTGTKAFSDALHSAVLEVERRAAVGDPR